MDPIFEELKKIIVEKLDNVDETKITPESKIREDLGADSIDTYELVYAIEEKMGIQIPNEQANEIVTVGDVLEFIKKNKK
jgi:acyl carrier protein